MKYCIFCLLSFLPASAESLHYVINWPSGLSLGEATLNTLDMISTAGTASHESLTSDFEIDVSIPGYTISDRYHSTAQGSGSGKDLCSTKLDKTVRRGSRKSGETDTFHQDTRTVTRETHGEGGGKSDLDVSDCARDALTFLEFARHELAQGRLAPQESIVLGNVYQVRLDGMGAQTVKVGGKPVEADRVQASIKGPASSYTVDVFFSRDPARTPVLISIPLALGKFTAELIH
jgi:hypothetical protein